MINDGTALVAYRFAIGAVSASFSLLDVGPRFLRVAGGADRDPAGLRGLGAPDVPAQRDPVRADRPQAPAGRQRVLGHPGRHPARLGGAVAATVVLVRLVWQSTTPYVIRALDRRPSRRARRAGWRPRLVVGWAGMHGAVSLAAALTIPNTPRAALRGAPRRSSA